MIIEISDDTPQAWKDLLVGLAILSRGQANDISPLYCSHDNLIVCADPKLFTGAELELLDMLGFLVDDNDECFSSSRFGSA